MKSIIAIAVSTVYLILLNALGFLNVSINLCAAMYLLSPAIIICTVVVVLKDQSSKYPELAEGDEWGYRDKSKNELGLF